MPRHFEARLLLLALALALLTLLGAAEATPPHLRLERSQPAADATVEGPVDEIRLFFSQAPELAVSRISLSWADGEIPLGDLAAGDDNSIRADVLEMLVPAVYTVSWRTSSGDGHPIRGTFEFTLAPDSD